MKKGLLLLLFFAAPCYANDLAKALQNLRPGAEWILTGDQYEGLEWMDKKQIKPSKQEIQDELDRLDIVQKRKGEYPTFEEKLDALIAGGQAVADIQKRISDVDKKYPMKANLK